MNNIVHDLSNTNNVTMDVFECHKNEFECHKNEFECHKDEFKRHQNEFEYHKNAFERQQGRFEFELKHKTIITNLESENQSLNTIIQELIKDKEQLTNKLGNLQREYNILRNKTSIQGNGNSHGNNHGNRSGVNPFFKMNFN